MPRESVTHTFVVAALLCVVCSVLVSTAAVGLRDRQLANQERQRKSNVLAVAGLAEEARRAGVEAVYEHRIVERLIDLESGQFVGDSAPVAFDQRRAARDPAASAPVPAELDAARLRRRERQSLVYLVIGDEQDVEQIVLPIRGYGLWSTLWGFIALDAASLRAGPAAITIRGLTYYEHAETPGLGGEVDRPSWQEQWRTGKRIYDPDWNVTLRVVKGAASSQEALAAYQVDGLSGATITSNGVTNMVQYWFGPHGFRPFLTQLAARPALLTEGKDDG